MHSFFVLCPSDSDSISGYSSVMCEAKWCSCNLYALIIITSIEFSSFFNVDDRREKTASS